MFAAGKGRRIQRSTTKFREFDDDDGSSDRKNDSELGGKVGFRQVERVSLHTVLVPGAFLQVLERIMPAVRERGGRGILLLPPRTLHRHSCKGILFLVDALPFPASLGMIFFVSL